MQQPYERRFRTNLSLKFDCVPDSNCSLKTTFTVFVDISYRMSTDARHQSSYSIALLHGQFVQLCSFFNRIIHFSFECSHRCNIPMYMYIPGRLCVVPFPYHICYMHVIRRRPRAINNADRNNENNLQIHRFAFPSPMRRIPAIEYTRCERCND